MIIKNLLHYLLGLLLLGVLSLYGFELPKMIPEGAAPEIINFTLYRPDDNNKGEYALVWDTKNATEIIISTIGEVEASGKYIVKKPDPDVEEIVLTVSNNSGFKPVSKSVYAKQPQSMGRTEETQDRWMDDDTIPMSPMRQRMIAPGRYRRY